MFFDQQKREQTHSKQLIRDSFGWLFQKNCKIIEAYFLHSQLPDLSMRVKEFDFSDAGRCKLHFVEKPAKKDPMLMTKKEK